VFEEGTTVADRYRVERKLGRGGMAEVFLARDLRLERPVALKVLAPALSSDPAFVARFRREAQAAAGLSHPNIVGVYDWGEEMGSYFIAMEYAPGHTLAEVIEAEAPLPSARVALIGEQVAAALAAAHRAGLVHRDVKPSNVILGEGDTVKVTDFGIAHVVEEAGTRLTATGTVLGTPVYLSPEQAEGRAVDARSDVYSLGVVLYELATGATPFEGTTSAALAYQHAREPFEPPSVRSPAVPAALDAVITESLAKDPDARPASAEQVRRRLAALTDPSEAPATAVTEVAATRVGPPAAVPPGRDHRLWWALAALGAALLGGLVVFLAFGRDSGSAQPTTHTTATTHHTTTSRPPTTSTSATTTTTPTTTALPTTFAGYAVVGSSQSGPLFCPSGVAVGQSSQTPPAAPPHKNKAPDGSNGQGGPPGCGSNGGKGGKGGKSSPDAAGGSGGNGGAGGCPPATLAQMQAGTRPCDGTGSDGGDGGDGGNAAPGASGGAGGVGGAGGNTTKARGGNGGKGGDAKPGQPGAAGGPGERGGGPDGTASGVNGANGTNG
jgi:serine/threonine protein kinase